MATEISTTVEPLDDNKVKLHVAVPAPVFEKAIDQAFRKLAREVKIPGFRPGKAPRRLLEARFGSEVAREQALRDSLPEYYADAVRTENIDVIAAPEIDITAGEQDGDVEFDAVVEVRPVVTLSGYDAIQVELADPTPTDEQVDASIDAFRERFATLDDSDAPLAEGHFALVDVTGRIDGEVVEGLSVTDYLYEVGSDGVVPELDRALAGKRPGDVVAFDAILPERFGDHAGADVAFQVLVKEAKRRKLPDLTDSWVADVSEFETVDELRADARRRLDLYARVQARLALRDRVLDAVADLVHVDVPPSLVDQDLQRRLHDLHHQLESRGLTIPQYLQATGRDQQGFVEELRAASAHAVRADLALRAVVVQEGIEPTDDEVDAAIAELAESLGQKPDKVRKDLVRRGVVDGIRSDIARGKALQFLVERATVVDADGNPLDLGAIEAPEATEANEATEATEATEASGEPTSETPGPAGNEPDEPEEEQHS